MDKKVDKASYLANLDRTPTTFEMDGLFTQEDIDNRNRVMKRCNVCNKWREQNLEDKSDKPCGNETKGVICESTSFDPKSTTSLRTWKPNSRKITKKEEKATW